MVSGLVGHSSADTVFRRGEYGASLEKFRDQLHNDVKSEAMLVLSE